MQGVNGNFLLALDLSTISWVLAPWGWKHMEAKKIVAKWQWLNEAMSSLGHSGRILAFKLVVRKLSSNSLHFIPQKWTEYITLSLTLTLHLTYRNSLCLWCYKQWQDSYHACTTWFLGFPVGAPLTLPFCSLFVLSSRSQTVILGCRKDFQIESVIWTKQPYWKTSFSSLACCWSRHFFSLSHTWKKMNDMNGVAFHEPFTDLGSEMAGWSKVTRNHPLGY